MQQFSKTKGINCHKSLLRLAALFLLTILITVPLLAADQVVTNLNDSGAGSLRQAIVDVGSGETITFSVTGTIVLASELRIDKSMTIAGPSADMLTISGNNAVAVFFIGYATNAINVTLSGLTIANGNNIVDQRPFGGGIFNRSTETLNINNSVITNNSLTEGYPNASGGYVFGGGIYNNHGTLNVTNSTVSNNFASFGGGIYTSTHPGAVTLTNSTISGNIARSGGGLNGSQSTVTLNSSTVSGNEAMDGNGGGLFNFNSIITITNSTVSGNETDGNGGGIYNTIPTILTISITNSTVTGNLATNIGGGIYNDDGTVNIENTIVAVNTASINGPDVGGTYNSLGYNLIGDGTLSSGFTATGDQVGTSSTPIDPLLGALEDNGGPTLTHALLSGSPAINTGDCPTTNADQRGFPRFDGSCDIGAFELGATDISDLVINEVDSDTESTDDKEFIELFDGGSGSTALDGLVVVFYNGSTDLSYKAIDLDGNSTDANGFFVIGNSAVPNVDLTFTDGLLQNGADAVALYARDGSDFPNGTAVTTSNLIDAIVYDTDDADDSGLLPLLNSGQPQVNENSNGNGTTESSQRFTNGSGGQRNTDTYLQATPTPDVVSLPVELSSFSAIVMENGIKLSWRTETEVNNYGFEIEREVGGRQSVVGKWDMIGFVEGNGNSNSPKEYEFIDDNVLSGMYAYRLKQIDNDGTFEYSKIIEIDVDAPLKFELSQNYPNPFNPSTTFKFSLPVTSNVKLSVFNILGEEVQILVNETIEAGVHIINFNASQLSSGMYIYRIQTGNFVEIKKMVFLQ